MKLNEINDLAKICKEGNLSDIAEYLNKSAECFTEEELKEIKKKSENNIVEQGEINDVNYEMVGSNQFKSFDITKLTKKEKSDIVDVPTREEARYISDIYYQIQNMRIGAEGQIRAMNQKADQDSEEIAEGVTKSNPVQSRPFLVWYVNNLRTMELEIAKALTVFSDSCYMGKWAKANIGIGPTIATQLVAYLDIPSDTGFYVGNWWSYCGLNDNNRPWLGREKSQKIVNEVITNKKITDVDVMKLATRTKWSFAYYEENAKKENGEWSKDLLVKSTAKIPYNKHMKVLMYKIGHQFVFTKNKPNSLYGRIYKERLAYEISKNENGDYKDQAAKILKEKNFNKSTTAYKEYSQGKLPPAHLSQRAQRYATKMFISHLYEAEYQNKFNKPAPNPYELAVQGHKGYIGPEVPYNTFKNDGI